MSNKWAKVQKKQKSKEKHRKQQGRQNNTMRNVRIGDQDGDQSPLLYDIPTQGVKKEVTDFLSLRGVPQMLKQRFEEEIEKLDLKEFYPRARYSLEEIEKKVKEELRQVFSNSEEKVNKWLDEPKKELGGTTPNDCIREGKGWVVYDMVYAMAAGWPQ